MEAHGLTTINLIFAEPPRLLHSRNAFAFGGVLEDPATGAAATALGGYLRDLEWPQGERLKIRQTVDIGASLRMTVTLTDEAASPVTVAGTAHEIWP